MLITEVKIRKTFSEGNLKAIVSITIDNCFAVHDIKIIQGADRIFVAMPSRKDESGNYHDVVNPIDSATRNDFKKIIFAAYENYVALESIMDDDRLLS